MYLPTVFEAKRFIRVFLTVMILVSCTSRTTIHTLRQAELLIHQRPDSSLTLLSSIEPKDLGSKPTRARYALLQSMAWDKNYIDVAEDSTITIAHDYYMKYGSTKDRMLASYYMGIVHENAGSFLQAATEFDAALSLARTINDYHYCGLCCQHLSRLYNKNYNHVKARDYSREAVDFFDACGEHLSADYSRVFLAEQLAREYQWDNALAILDTVISTNTKPRLRRLALWIKTDALLYGKDDYTGAMECLGNMVVGYNRVDSLAYYGYRGVVCEKLGNSVEAKRCFAIAMPLMLTSTDSLTLFSQISQACSTRHDYEGAFSYLKKATSIQSVQITELLEQSVSSAMEEYFRESLKEEQRSHKKTMVIYLLSGIILLLVIISLHTALRRLKASHIQDLLDIDNLNHEITQLRNNNEYFRRINDTVLHDRMVFLSQLSESYFSWSDDEIRRREKEGGPQSKEELILQFRRQLGALRSDKQLFVCLEDVVNGSKDNLMNIIRNEYGNQLKESDYNLLSLFLSGLSNKSIAFLLKMSEPALRTRKSRFRRFFAEHPSPNSAPILNEL